MIKSKSKNLAGRLRGNAQFNDSGTRERGDLAGSVSFNRAQDELSYYGLVKLASAARFGSNS
jgi:hypothetical protein